MSASSTLFVQVDPPLAPMVVLVASSHRLAGSIDADFSGEPSQAYCSGCCVAQPTDNSVIKMVSIKPSPRTENLWYPILASEIRSTWFPSLCNISSLDSRGALVHHSNCVFLRPSYQRNSLNSREHTCSTHTLRDVQYL